MGRAGGGWVGRGSVRLGQGGRGPEGEEVGAMSCEGQLRLYHAAHQTLV